MKIKMLTIAAILAATLLTGFLSTPMAYADESETSTEQELKQKNIGSGASTNTNCGSNSIDSAIEITLCPGADIDIGDGTDPVPPVVTCEECLAELTSSLSANDATVVAAALMAADFDCDGLTEAEITELAAVFEPLRLSEDGAEQ